MRQPPLQPHASTTSLYFVGEYVADPRSNKGFHKDVPPRLT